VTKGTTLAALSGPSHQVRFSRHTPAICPFPCSEAPPDVAGQVLRLERIMLNTVGRLSGIATRTRDFRETMLKCAGAGCKTVRLFHHLAARHVQS
jgi:hypothetical protein